MTHAGQQAPENNGFAASSIHLKLRRECKEDYMTVGEGKAGTGLDYVLS